MKKKGRMKKDYCTRVDEQFYNLHPDGVGKAPMQAGHDLLIAHSSESYVEEVADTKKAFWKT